MKKHTQTILTILMFGIVFATGTLLVSVWVFPPPERTATIAMLNENLQAGPYPSNVTLNSNITLNIEVSNFLGAVQYFYVHTKLANSSTLATATTPSSAPILQEHQYIVANGGTRRFLITLNMTTPGTNYRLTFELWRYDPNSDEIVWVRDPQGRGLWVHWSRKRTS